MRDLYLLRKHFQVSALDALYGLPAWEVDMLLSGLQFERAQPAAGDSPEVEPPRAPVDPVGIAKELDGIGRNDG